MAETLELTVTGMTCNHCEMRVAKALKALPGVEEARPDHQADRCTVTYDPGAVTPEQMVAAVVQAGYQASLPEG
ncbi:MAG: heavy-metal-associated domain-containing protein [Nitrospirae bacterium]|nr:MAG: heavy-metal-associated domain-containing protein [Nitrospirota bacterium]